MKKFLNLEFLPLNADLGLLALRLGLGVPLIVFHGWGKLMKLISDSPPVPDVLHIGAIPTSILAVFAEVVCASLVVLGLWTRFATVFIIGTLGCAFVFYHKMAFTGMNSGEKPFLFLIGFLALLFAGAGKYSFDKK